MSNESEKFVLQYVTEIKDSIKNLEQLQSKIKQTGEASDKTGKELKEFANGAADEVGKLVPGINSVTSAVRMMGAEFVVAGAAIAAIAVGVKSVIALRDQYGTQRGVASVIGTGSTQVEEYTRKIMNLGGQSISRDKTNAGLQHAAQMFQSSYVDPQRMGPESRALRMMGVDVGQIGSPKSFNEMFTQLATSASKMKPEEAQGKLQAMGFDKDFAEAIRKAGPEIGVITEQTLKEVEANQKAQESLAKFNTELNKFDEAILKLQISLGQKLLPAVTAVTTWIADKLDGFQRSEHKLEDQYSIKGGALSQGYGPMTVDSYLNSNFNEYLKEQTKDSKDKKNDNKPVDLITQAFKDQQKHAQKKVDQENLNAQKVLEAQDEMRLAVNMFNGAVTTFANAVDMNQAIAAWAGQVGKDAGLGSGGNSFMDRSLKRRSGGGAGGDFSPYEAMIMEASEAFGVPVDLIKKVMKGESSLNPNAVSKAGAQGLMQVMPGNFKALNMSNGFDPRQSIMGGTQLLAEALKMSGGDLEEALRIYQGGPNRKKWGKENAAYAQYILGQDVSGASGAPENPAEAHRNSRGIEGEQRSSLALRTVEQNIADRLGVPLAQLKSGGVTQGDVAFARQQLEAGTQNNITKTKTELNNVMLPPVERGRLQQQLVEQLQGLQQLQQLGTMVENQAAPGGRQITIGELKIQVNMPAGADGQAVGIEAAKAFSETTNSIVNQYSSAVKL